MKNMTAEKIMKLKDPEIEAAVFQPKASRLAQKVFDFLRDNSNLVTTAGGMQHYVTGMNRYQLIQTAKAYNLNLSRYMFAVKWFEDGLLKTQENNLEK